ncbi:HNH endonuclease signature motif containing protein [Bradyrhizobium sp. CCGUVB23]|uniref:HNH endonuclease signature motif containing protein n=1 Tax=Bradyrhizobium sp. CCGUVB23 TaxID=2949630 RepID=UPI0020B31F0A|nr:HNH endonuclease signature motif containing protein [Bradyrhizobium sp. CCGUVB23]MCP3460439.1 HNH endonuclease [Bradyrhizobium sp. CCGUVB23]
MRTPIPDDVATEVLYQHDRTCCVCNEPGKAIQIHHIDEDPSNHDPNNLAVLCLQDHEETQIRGGFGRKLRALDVTKCRDEWTRRVRERRAEVDKIVIERLAAVRVEEPTPPPVAPERKPFRYRPSAKILALYLQKVPDILAVAYAKADDITAEEGDSRSARAAAQLIVGVLEQVLVELSHWVDPEHFDGKPPRDFYSGFIAGRNQWNRILVEPKDYGYRARTGTVEMLDSTIVDARVAIASLVTALTKAYLKAFDVDDWTSKLPRLARS